MSRKVMIKIYNLEMGEYSHLGEAVIEPPIPHVGDTIWFRDGDNVFDGKVESVTHLIERDQHTVNVCYRGKMV